MKAKCRCHSCGTPVHANTRRCHNCYVALEAASRPPSPLRAAPSAPLGGGQLALAAPALAHTEPFPAAVRCPACQSSVMPLTGWCSYCMEPLPFDHAPFRSSAPAGWAFEDLEALEDDEPGPASPASGGQVIVGPWPDRATGPTYATWRQRAAAALIDSAVFVPFLVAMAFSTTVGLILLVAAVAFSAWQVCALQGRTGQTIGKNRVGIFLVHESDLAPIGTRRAALRQLAHGIDAVLLGVGYLWPGRADKRQTFADRLFSTVVVAD